MNKQSIFLLPRKLAWKCKRVIKKLFTRLRGQEQKLVFIFGGRIESWTAMGQDLYASEPVFRSSILQSDAIIKELGWNGILKNFEPPPDDNFLSDEINLIFTITALQIALSDLWKSKNIYPNAVMGISLGEMAAVYAAGGLTLRDVLRVTGACTFLSRDEKEDFTMFYARVNIEEGIRISKSSPVFISVVYEASAEGVLILAHKNNQEKVGQFLTGQNIDWRILYEYQSWPYHSNLLLKHGPDILNYISNIEPLPLQCDFFSTHLGRVVPRGSIIENKFWSDLKHYPVHTHSVLESVKNQGYEILLHVGPDSFLKMGNKSNQDKQTKLLYSMKRSEDERQFFEATQKKISNIRRQPSSLTSSKNTTEDFIHHFNFLHSDFIQNPFPYFNFLQKNGSVHYLPADQGWIIFDYDDIEYVLKNPQLFSSTIHKTFDEFLLGADPPSHTAMRSLLQPLFSQQTFSMLGEHTAIKSRELIDQLPRGRAFNFVNDFSLPLTASVTAKLLGLSPAEEKELGACINSHVYELKYLQQLEAYCKNYLDQNKLAADNTIAGLLHSFVRENKLPFSGAVSTMRMLWIAGMTTTSMLISSAVYMLAKDRELAAKLRENESLISKFIEECLRLETPESELRRITTEEVLLGEKKIPAGSMLMLCLRAANRDARYFENPEQISFDRPAKRHLSFGGGYHYCMGIGMARTEAKQAIKILLEQVPDLGLEDENAAVYFPSPHFRGLEKLNIRI